MNIDKYKHIICLFENADSRKCILKIQGTKPAKLMHL